MTVFRDFHPTASEVLSALALLTIALLSILLVFHSPEPTSKELLLILIGALAGALTVGGGRKIADKITNSSGPDATVMPDSPAPVEDEKP